VKASPSHPNRSVIEGPSRLRSHALPRTSPANGRNPGIPAKPESRPPPQGGRIREEKAAPPVVLAHIKPERILNGDQLGCNPRVGLA
jgi:hypothetical protein